MVLKFHVPQPYDEKFTVGVRVSTEGIFSCTLPDEWTAPFVEKLGMPKPSGKSTGIIFSRDTFQGLKDAVEKAFHDLCSEKEVARAKVIKFAIETTCCYAVSPSGGFWPFPAHPLTGADWRNGTVSLDANNPRPFGLRVYAHVFDRVTYRYESTGKERVEYVSLEDRENDDFDDPIQWLCKLRCLSTKDGYWGSNLAGLQEVPYTPEVGNFFVGLFKWLFSVNERIKPFLNPEGIMALASGKALPPLLKEGNDGKEGVA